MALSKELQARVNKHKKTWATARKTKPGEFSVPDIKDGEYACRVTAKYGVGKKGKKELFARLEWTILKGKYKGASSSSYFNLDNENQEYREAAWKSLAANVQVLTGEDTSTDEYKNDPTLLFALLDRINKEKPHCMCALTNGVSEKGKKYINAYFNSLIEDGDDDEDEDEKPETSSKGGGKKGGKKKTAKDEDDDDEDEDDDDEDSDDDDEDESDDDEDDDDSDDDDESDEDDDESDDEEESDDEDDEEDEEEEEDSVPEKGDIVKFIPKGQKKAVKCEVMTVNKGAKTVTLKNVDTDKQYKACPWDKLKY